MNITDSDITAGASGEDCPLPSMREHLLRFAMRHLALLHEQTETECRYNVTGFPTAHHPEQQANWNDRRARYMLHQSAARMGFTPSPYLHRGALGNALTDREAEETFHAADPAYIALLLLYRGIRVSDPGEALAALDFAAEWIMGMMAPGTAPLPPEPGNTEPESPAGGPSYFRRSYYVREDLAQLLHDEAARQGHGSPSEALESLLERFRP